MALIKYVHHIAMKADTAEQFEKTVKFYTETLGLPVKRQWKTGIMIRAGETLFEIFNNGGAITERGALQHVALATDSVDECIKAVTEAGYEIIAAVKDTVIPSDPPYPIRCAFCRGPLGEEIEFFEEK